MATRNISHAISGNEYCSPLSENTTDRIAQNHELKDDFLHSQKIILQINKNRNKNAAQALAVPPEI